MGLFAAFASAVLSATKDLISKRLSFQVDGTASTFASFAFALPFYVVLLAGLYVFGNEELALTRDFLILVLLRASTDTFAEWMKMCAFSYGDISVISSFFSISPLFLLLIGPIVTDDRPTLLGIVAVVVVVLGSLVLVYRPSERDWTSQRKGILLSIGASFFFALNTCFDRLAVEKGTPVMAGFAMTLVSALFLLPFVLPRRDRLAALKRFQAGCWWRGFFEAAFMCSKLYAVQVLGPYYVVGINRLSLVISIIGGRALFHERDFGRRLTAGVLILLGVFLIVWLEVRKHGTP